MRSPQNAQISACSKDLTQEQSPARIVDGGGLVYGKPPMNSQDKQRNVHDSKFAALKQEFNALKQEIQNNKSQAQAMPLPEVKVDADGVDVQLEC